MQRTTVVNVYRDEYDVYIGRAGKGQSGYFGNPCYNGTRSEKIEAFRKYFHKRLKADAEFNRRVRVLKGKRLACFCKPKKACHGDIIAAYLNGLPEEKPIRLAVVGSRSFRDYKFMEEILRWYTVREIISGGARGADSLARRWAGTHSIPLREFFPDWDRLGKSAGFRRNEQIVEACDEVVAFWDNRSKGTAHTIKLAEEQGKPVSTYWPSIKSSIPHDEISIL